MTRVLELVSPDVRRALERENNKYGPPQPPFDFRRRRLLRHENRVFVAYNSSALPFLLMDDHSESKELPLEMQRDELKVGCLPQRHYASNKFPFNGWMPAEPSFQGTLLGRLDSPNNKFPLENQGNFWALDETTRQEWKDLEEGLVTVVRQLIKMQPGDMNTLPLMFEFPRLPREFGYLQTLFKTPREARRALWRSRNAYLPIMAMASGLIAILRDSARKKNQDVETWACILGESRKLEAGWADQLMECDIARHDVARVGVVVNISTCDYLDKLHAFVNQGLPVWFDMGDGSQDYGNRKNWANAVLQDFEEGVKSILSDSASQPCYIPFIDTLELEIEDAVTMAPVPEAHSGQKRGESFHAFVASREDRYKDREQRETPTQRQSRLGRLQAAAQFKAPGKRGAWVYKWDEVRPGQWIRRYVERRNVEKIWGLYTNSQKFFNAFANEWDLYPGNEPRTGLGSDLSSNDSDAGSSSHDSLAGFAASSGKETSIAPLSSGRKVWDAFANDWIVVPEDTPPSRYLDDLRRYNDEFCDPISLEFDPIERLAYLRFGFHLDVDLEKGEDITSSVCPVDWKEAEFRMCTHPKYLPPTKEVPTLVKRAIALLIHWVGGKKEPDKIPWSITDMHPKNSQYVAHRIGKHFNIFTLQHKETIRTEERHQARNIEFTVFCFQPKNGNVLRWRFATNEPINVLHAIRSNTSTLHELAQHFVERGIPFNTITPEPGTRRDDVVIDRARYMRICWRPEGTTLTIDDYLQYERRVRDLLRDERIARVAIMSGGILWRLAIDVLGFDAAVNLTLDGPSQHRCRHIYKTWDGENSKEWWDDTMTEEEQYLLTGTYKMYTKDRGAFSFSSWWPKTNIWATSSMDCGYWSTYDEYWYRERLASLRSGSASVKTQTDWRKELKCRRRGKSIASNFSSCFSELLHTKLNTNLQKLSY